MPPERSNNDPALSGTQTENPLDQLFAATLSMPRGSAFWHHGNTSLDYADLLDKARRCQAWLVSLGVQAGQQVLIQTSHDRELIPLLIGSWGAGLVVAIIDPQMTEQELAQVLQEISPDYIFADELRRFSERESMRFQIKPDPKRKGLLNKLMRDKSPRQNSDIPGLFNGEQAAESWLDLHPADDALILFSSGTTGLPKGMVLSFRAMLGDISAMIRRMGYSSAHVIHNTLPLHHVDGLLHGPLLALFAGSSLVRSGHFSVAHIDEYLGEMYRLQITHLVTVPAVLSIIRRVQVGFPDLFSWPGFECIVSTAGPLDAGEWTDLEAMFGRRICNVYGLSETAFAATVSGPDDGNARIGTVGKALDGVELCVVDERGQLLPSPGTGEVLIRGDILFSRYLNRPQETSQVVSDGWLKTGDLGYLDTDGFLTITGRIKNIIIRGGENVSPEEVRACLLKHPCVDDAEVIGIPDRHWGELTAAAVVAANESATGEELMSHCETLLSSWKCPDRYFFLQRLPRGPSGKVQRKLLLEQYQEQCRQRTDPGRQGLEQSLLELAANIFNTPIAKLSMESEPGTVSGWNSLAHLEFVMEVERMFGFQFSAREMMGLQSMRQITIATRKKVQ